jgi:hypothetical protein
MGRVPGLTKISDQKNYSGIFINLPNSLLKAGILGAKSACQAFPVRAWGRQVYKTG